MRKLLFALSLPLLLASCSQQYVACPDIGISNSIQVKITGMDPDLITSPEQGQAMIPARAQVCKDDICTQVETVLLQDAQTVQDTSDADGPDGVVSATVVPLDNGVIIGGFPLDSDVTEGTYTISVELTDLGARSPAYEVDLRKANHGTEQCPLVATSGQVQMDWADFNYDD